MIRIMNIDIRNHIINNFKEDNKDVLRDAINESIENKDEITLPGEGVFFELLWQNADNDLKDKILDIIEKAIKDSE